MTTFYEFRMLNLPSRYQLSAKAQTVLKAHDDYKTSQISEAELGRLIRLSTGNRNAIVQTMVKLSEIMANKPEEAKHCVAIIKTCGEIITIADKPVQTTGFPYFFKLPPEVRNRIYKFYLKTSEKVQTLVPHPKRPGGCFCAPHEASSWRGFERKPVAALRANRQLRDEIFAALYKRYIFHYPCTCEMARSLTNDFQLRDNIRSIKFHWCGPQSDAAIAKLKDCEKLEALTVIISQSTMSHLTRREQEFRQFFGRKTKVAITDALGIDELIRLRGIKEVEVETVDKRKADMCSATEKAHLRALLNAKLTQPRKEDDYGSDWENSVGSESD